MTDKTPKHGVGGDAFWGVILGGIVALAGSVGTATLAHYFSIHEEERKQWEAQRAAAYIDYVRESSAEQLAGTGTQRQEILARENDALTRVAIYGGKDVNEALAGFQSGPDAVDSPQSRREIIAVYQAIRNEAAPENEALPNDTLYKLLFGRN